jgi:hypothetical protein
MTGRVASQIRLRPCGDNFAFASIGVDGWPVTGIAVRLDDNGARIDWPTRDGKCGTKWPIVSPPPGQRDQLELRSFEAVEGAICRVTRR